MQTFPPLGPEEGTQNKINQDCAVVCHPYCADPLCAFFGVFDGHGRYGEVVSTAVMDFIVGELERRLLLDEGINAALTFAFEEANLHLAQLVPAFVRHHSGRLDAAVRSARELVGRHRHEREALCADLDLRDAPAAAKPPKMTPSRSFYKTATDLFRRRVTMPLTRRGGPHERDAPQVGADVRI